MKKLYSTLGMLLSVGVMFAANDMMKNVELQHLDVSKYAPELLEMKAQMGKQEKPAKVAINMDDVYGQYLWIAVGALVTDYRGYTQGDMTIYPGDGANEVYVYGINMYSGTEIVANVDPNAGTISFPNRQQVGTYTYGGANDPVYFLHMRWNATGDGIDEVSDDLVGYFDENGAFSFDPEDLIAIWIPSLDGGFFLKYVNMMAKRSETLNNDGWTNAGTATVSNLFFGGFVEYITGENPAPYTVSYQTYNEDPNIIRLVDPYGPATPYADFVIGLSEGQLIFDLTDPEAVAVLANYNMVIGYDANNQDVYAYCGYYSGFMMTDMCMYPDNAMDYYLQEGYDYESLKEALPTLGYKLSTFENNVITINDPFMSYSFEFHQDFTSWAQIYGIDASFGTPIITLHPNGEGGVGSLNSDENAPVKYYNLQGVEVVNPAKGQLVIKKQGNTVTKFIAR